MTASRISADMQTPRRSKVASGIGGISVIDHQGRVLLVDGDAMGTDIGEEVIGEGRADHVVRGRLEGEDRQPGGVDPVLEIGEPVPRHRGHEDQHFRQHHEEDRQAPAAGPTGRSRYCSISA